MSTAPSRRISYPFITEQSRVWMFKGCRHFCAAYDGPGAYLDEGNAPFGWKRMDGPIEGHLCCLCASSWQKNARRCAMHSKVDVETAAAFFGRGVAS